MEKNVKHKAESQTGIYPHTHTHTTTHPEKVNSGSRSDPRHLGRSRSPPCGCQQHGAGFNKREEGVRGDSTGDEEIIKRTCHVTSPGYFARVRLFQPPLFSPPPFKAEQEDTKRDRRERKGKGSRSPAGNVSTGAPCGRCLFFFFSIFFFFLLLLGKGR